MTSLQQAWGDLHEKANSCLRFLADKGLSEAFGDKRTLPKSNIDPARAKAVRLDKGQVIWLKLADRNDLDQEYRPIEISDAPLKTDKAIIAAVAARDSVSVRAKHPNKAILLYKVIQQTPLPRVPTDGTTEEMVVQSILSVLSWAGGLGKPLKKAVESIPEISDARRGDTRDALKYRSTFALVESLLQYFRPDYEKLSRQDQAALIEGACSRLNVFHTALEDLVAFLEYGSPGKKARGARKLKPGIEDAQRDINAALLKHVAGLPNCEIGKRLRTKPRGTKQKEKQKDYDDSTARGWIKRGTDLLRRGWGEEGYRELITTMKAEQDHWRGLSEEERLFEDTAQDIAGMFDVPMQEVLQIIELGEPNESKDGFTYVQDAFTRGAKKLDKGS